MRILRTILVAGAAIAVLGGGVALANSTVNRVPAAGFTYSIFDRPQNSADRAAIARYQGDSSQVSLATARLLGTDEIGNQYFAVRDVQQSCFVVVHSADASSGACNPLGKVAEKVPWLKFGDENGDRLAIMVPDGYSADAVKGAKRPLLSEPNLVVLPSSMSASEVVTIPGLGGREAVVVDTAGE